MAMDPDSPGKQLLSKASEESVSSSEPSIVDVPKQFSMKARKSVQRMFPQYISPMGNFDIQGNESQILHMQLNPGEEVLVESGGMRYLSPGITPEARMGDFWACCCGCEELFRVVYKNNSAEDGALIGIAPNFNANIIPVDLNLYPDLVVRGGTFLAAQDTSLQIQTRRVKHLSGAFAGHGVMVHPLQGKGIVFLNAGGTIMIRELKPNEVMYASSNAVIAYQDKVTVTVEAVGGGVTNVCCGGQGLVNTKFVGADGQSSPGGGLVILQSLSLQELRAAIHGTR